MNKLIIYKTLDSILKSYLVEFPFNRFQWISSRRPDRITEVIFGESWLQKGFEYKLKLS